MSLATTKFSPSCSASPRLLKSRRGAIRRSAARLEGAQPRRADHGARRGDRPLVRDRGGKVTSGAGRHAKPDITLAFKNAALGAVAADAADQLARPDQRAEGLQAHRRRPGGPHQLVRADHDDEPDRGLASSARRLRRRHHALLQHDQRRPGVRLRQGRQDRAHDADRFRRQRRRSPGPSRRAA